MDKNVIKLLTILAIIIAVIAYVFSVDRKENYSNIDSEKNANIINEKIYENTANNTLDDKEKLNIVTSFYPIYIITLNVTNGVQNVNVSNMSENLRGCIHDYTLSTNDLKKAENADVFIETGENLEPFSDKIKNTYPNLKIIDSGKNARNLIGSEDDGVNPHIWMSFTNYIDEVNEIANEISKIDVKNKEQYLENAKNYCEKVNAIMDKCKSLNLQGKSAICLDEGVEYLLKEIGMDVTLIETDHENSALSADVVKSTIEQMKEKSTKAIFIEKNGDSKNAEMLAKETGAKIYRIDANMSGENTKDSYISAMNENFEVLKLLNN